MNKLRGPAHSGIGVQSAVDSAVSMKNLTISLLLLLVVAAAVACKGTKPTHTPPPVLGLDRDYSGLPVAVPFRPGGPGDPSLATPTATPVPHTRAAPTHIVGPGDPSLATPATPVPHTRAAPTHIVTAQLPATPLPTGTRTRSQPSPAVSSPTQTTARTPAPGLQATPTPSLPQITGQAPREAGTVVGTTSTPAPTPGFTPTGTTRSPTAQPEMTRIPTPGTPGATATAATATAPPITPTATATSVAGQQPGGESVPTATATPTTPTPTPTPVPVQPSWTLDLKMDWEPILVPGVRNLRLGMKANCPHGDFCNGTFPPSPSIDDSFQVYLCHPPIDEPVDKVVNNSDCAGLPHLSYSLRSTAEKTQRWVVEVAHSGQLEKITFKWEPRQLSDDFRLHILDAIGTCSDQAIQIDMKKPPPQIYDVFGLPGYTLCMADVETNTFVILRREPL